MNPDHKYRDAHPESPLGKLFLDSYGDPEWKLVAVRPNGLLVLRRRNWLERFLRL